MTHTTPWRGAAVAALALACSAGAAVAQQPATVPANVSPLPPAKPVANVSPLPAPQHPGQRTMTHRDSPDAAKPAGFNPRFSPDGERFVEQGGQQLYQSICQGCHMPQGEGAKGAGFYPALAGNTRLAAGAYPVYVVLNGLHGMPPFGKRLDDQQVADVVNYIRTHFGNQYQDAVTPEAVKKQRQ